MPRESQRPQYYDVLMLDARLRQSLATVRSLGKRGPRVAAMATCETPLIPAFSSRWCQHKFICPASEGSQEYLIHLRQVLETTRPRVLIPAADGTIELLRQHRAELEQYTQLTLAKEPGLGIAVNKEQTLREIGLPAVVKPTESWDKRGAMRQEVQLVTTSEEARYAVERLTRMGGSVLMQQFISGGREAVCLFYA